MNRYFVFTKRRLLLAFCLFVCAICVCIEFADRSNRGTNVVSNEDRLIFIKQSGYTTLSTEPTTKVVCIPVTFGDVYNNYNTIQQKSGYDLSMYKGCEVTIYTYSINPPNGYDGACVINLICYNNRVIGGDVSSTALGGFMLPIKQEEK